MRELKPLMCAHEPNIRPMYDKYEVDAAIDELKTEHHKELHEYIEMAAQLRRENAELKEELDAANNQCENIINSATDIMLRQDKVNDAKCAEIENIKSENRRLKRALWLARAKWALEKIAWFKLWNASISTMNPEDGSRQEFDKWKKALGKFLKKAEEYK
jgi:cell division septum initiation protein DivIVA